MIEVSHTAPVWKDRANFIIGYLEEGPNSIIRREQLWTRLIEDDTFEICCIPFFVYNLALGDIVQTRPLRGFNYVLDRVIQPSGRYTFRAWFSSADSRKEVYQELFQAGCLMECRFEESKLLAVDAASLALAQTTSSILLRWQELGRLTYETGRVTDNSQLKYMHRP